MGHVSNYIVCKAYLADNPQWRAQQDALGADSDGVGEPTYVDVDRLAIEKHESDDDDEPMSDMAVAGDTAHEHEMLAYPLLSDEQSRVWLHSRQDLLRVRLYKMLLRSRAHMTPRRMLALRLGLRPVQGSKRALIAFLNRYIAAGYVERVRVQMSGASPLYLRATPHGLATAFGEQDAAGDAAQHGLDAWRIEREATIEQQLIAYIYAAGNKGCTLHDLAEHFHASTDMKRIIEQILARTTAPPYTPYTICAPFEQEGRERRVRYYAFAGFQARCKSDGVDLATGLGLAPGSHVPIAPATVPPRLPGEALFADKAAYRAALDGMQRRELGFFRDVEGPVALHKRKFGNVDPATGQAKRGRPRKVPKAEPDEAPPPPPAVAPAPAPALPEVVPSAAPSAWSQLQPAAPRADARRTNLSTFHRSALLLDVVERAGGAVDELDVPRMLKEQGTTSTDLSDRTTRSKVIKEAVQRGLLRTTKVQREVGDVHRQRTILYVPTLSDSALQQHVRDVVEGHTARGTIKHADVSAADAGLAAVPSSLPWASERSADELLDDPSTREAFARLSHVLRPFYGFFHGAAVRLRLFHGAALAAHADPLLLDYFWTACPLWTYVALVPVKLRTRTVVKAVLGAQSRTMPVRELPEPVAQRLGLRRIKAHATRFQSYAEQLVALGCAARDRDAYRLTNPTLGDTTYDVHTPDGFDAYWRALHETYAREDGPEAPLGILHARHAWQDSFVLRRPQKLFLRRFVQHAPDDALIDRLAHACLAPRDAVAAYFAAPRAARPADVLSHKVALRRAQRESEFDAMLAAEQAEHAVPEERREAVAHLIAQHKRRYLHGREALAPAELQARLRTTFSARPPRRVRRTVPRTRSAMAWTPERQELLRDAYIVLRERHHHAGGVPDYSALLQLTPGGQESAWTTWRVRLKQLMHSRTEQVSLRLLERAWAPLVAAARASGALDDPHFPHMTSLDLGAHVAYLRAHLDKGAVLAAHADAAKHVTLPLRLGDEAALWVPLVPRTSLALPSENMPMVHRLQAQRVRPLSWATFSSTEHAPDGGGCARAAVRMLVHADAGAVQHLAATLGEQAVDAAIAQLVAERVVRVAGERNGRVQLVFTEECMRALQEPYLLATMRDAQHAARRLFEAGRATAHPAATDGETAAWISLMDAGAVRATLDMAPLHELRKRTQLNARTLDDVETECAVHLAAAGEMRVHAEVSPVPWPAPCGSFACADDPRGVPVARLAPDELAAADGALAAGAAYAVGYDAPRIVAAAHLSAWTLPGADGRFLPCAWRDMDGALRHDVWAQRVQLVQSWVTSRPGLSLAHLALQLRPAVDRLELLELVRGLQHAGVVRVRAPHPLGLAPDEATALDVGACAWFAVV